MPRYDIDSLDNRDPEAIARFADLVEPIQKLWFRPVVRGLEHVPPGPCLYVGNHSGGLATPDTFVLGVAAYRRHGISAMPYGLAHGVALQLEPLQRLIVPLGAVRASHDTASRVFAAGGKVLVYPGGDLDAFRSFRRRDEIEFGPRRGYIRLALREGVPIVPIVGSGGHETFVVLSEGKWLARLLRFDRILRAKVAPVIFSVPWGITVGLPLPQLPLPVRIWVEVLPPVHFERTGSEAAEDADYVEQCHRSVHGQMSRALQQLAAERRAAG